MKPFHYFTALLISLSLFGCKPKETTLSGQMFVVTRGAENIKLGLVEVQLIEKDSVTEFIRNKQAAIDAEIAARQSEYAAAKNDDEKAASDFNNFKTNSPFYKSDFAEMKAKREGLLLELDGMTKQIDAINKEGTKLATELDDILRAYDSAEEASEWDNYLLAAMDKVNEQKKFAKKCAELNQLLPQSRVFAMAQHTQITTDTVVDNSYFNAVSVYSLMTSDIITESYTGDKSILQERILNIVKIIMEFTLIADMGKTDGSKLDGSKFVEDQTTNIIGCFGVPSPNSLLGFESLSQARHQNHKDILRLFQQELKKQEINITKSGPIRANGESEGYAMSEANTLKERMEKITNDAEQQGKPLADKLEAAALRFKAATLKISEPYPIAETYFTNFSPVVINKALTDADGKFSLSYPRDKTFALFAKAERLVGDKKEIYYWLVSAPPDGETAQIFLSNNNLITVDPDGYFKIKPKLELQESTP
jgi:hypothetical protein